MHVARDQAPVVVLESLEEYRDLVAVFPDFFKGAAAYDHPLAGNLGPFAGGTPRDFEPEGDDRHRGNVAPAHAADTGEGYVLHPAGGGGVQADAELAGGTGMEATFFHDHGGILAIGESRVNRIFRAGPRRAAGWWRERVWRV
jgi:hypothetical protein